MKIKAFKTPGARIKIEQTPVKRQWMEDTPGKHAYHCFPVTMANSIGWTISMLDDIEFIWDGITDTTEEHVKILKDPFNVCNHYRGNATISFNTGLIFRTEPDISILSIVPPNFFIDGIEPYTSVISTSFFEDPYPAAWRITRPNVKIVVPAGTPICTLIPISLGKLSEMELDIYDWEKPSNFDQYKKERNAKWAEISKNGNFTDFYRNAVDHNGNSIGTHERKNISMPVNNHGRMV
jgi:hypothetical protein